MISEKDKMIVDAVNEWKGNSSHFKSTFVYMTAGGYFVFGGDRGDDEFYTRVCTRKEFNKCVDELSESKWMQNPVEELMLSARESAKDINFQYHHFIKNDISEFPFEEDDKSDAKEWAEIKAAKEKQLSYLKKKYTYMSDVATLNALFFQMQKDGDLAEVLLPLEK